MQELKENQLADIVMATGKNGLCYGKYSLRSSFISSRGYDAYMNSSYQKQECI